MVFFYFTVWLVKKTRATLFNQSDTNSKPIAEPVFSRASGYLLVLDSSFHRFPLTFSFLLIGRPDHFERGFMAFN